VKEKDNFYKRKPVLLEELLFVYFIHRLSDINAFDKNNRKNKCVNYIIDNQIRFFCIGNIETALSNENVKTFQETLVLSCNEIRV